MAQVTTRKVVEGLNNLVLHVVLESDGSGELSDYIMLSPTDLTPVRAANQPTFRIMQVWYSMTGFDLILKYGGVTPRPVWTISNDGGNHIDFRSFGGIADYATVPPSDQNGKLLVSTIGFSGAGEYGSLVFEIRKP